MGEPQHLPAPINGPGSEVAPVLTASGALYYAEYAPRPRIMRAQRDGTRWLAPLPVGDTTDADGLALAATVSPDERLMVVSVLGRQDALHSAEAIYQRADLYVRTRQGTTWSPLRHLPAPINSAADELAPMFTPDGRTLFFTSERGSFAEHDRPHDYDAFVRALHESGNGLGDILQRAHIGVGAAAVMAGTVGRGDSPWSDGRGCGTDVERSASCGAGPGLRIAGTDIGAGRCSGTV